jgi:hypothetical protein
MFAIERMAIAQQTMLRAARLESGLCTDCMDEALFRDGENFVHLSAPDPAENVQLTRAQNRNFALAFGFRKMAESGNAWALCLRYKNEAERHYRRAVEEFERLKKLRAELPNDPDFYLQPDPEPPVVEEPNRPDSPQSQPNTSASTDSINQVAPVFTRGGARSQRAASALMQTRLGSVGQAVSRGALWARA